jgi:hypothetical protein
MVGSRGGWLATIQPGLRIVFSITKGVVLAPCLPGPVQTLGCSRCRPGLLVGGDNLVGMRGLLRPRLPNGSWRGQPQVPGGRRGKGQERAGQVSRFGDRSLRGPLGLRTAVDSAEPPWESWPPSDPGRFISGLESQRPVGRVGHDPAHPNSQLFLPPALLRCVSETQIRSRSESAVLMDQPAEPVGAASEVWSPRLRCGRCAS